MPHVEAGTQAVGRQKLTDEDRGYLAGLIDAKGYLWIERRRTKKRVYRSLRLRISDLSEAQADWIETKFPGVTRMAGCLPSGIRTTFVTPAVIAAIFVETHASLLEMKKFAPLVFRFAKTASSRGKGLARDDDREREAIDCEISALRKGA